MATADKSTPNAASLFWNWPAGLLDALKMPVPAAAPQNLTQPILPWVFANSISVNNANSSCPELEMEIVARQSYGRQLGRVMPALQALIQERPEGAPPNPAFAEFLALSQEIQSIKDQSLASRVSRLESDLAWVKAHDAEAYRQIAGKFSLQGKVKR